MQQESDPPPALPFTGSREFVHRINNLLTIVLAQSEASLSSQDPEEMKHALEIVVETSSCMADLVRAFARSQAEADPRRLQRDGGP